MNRLLPLILMFIFTFHQYTFAQKSNTLNTNYLIEHGVSPRVLDFAASPFMQDGHFTENVTISYKSNGKTETYGVELIFDPSYREGMDIRLVVKKGELSKKTQKKLLKFIEQSHYFSRMSTDYLYDEATLKVIEDNSANTVLAFKYRNKDIDPYLSNIKNMQGKIYFIDGELDRVELKNIKPLKHGWIDFKKVVRYARLNTGGHIVKSYDEYITNKRGEHYTISAKTTAYTDEQGNLLTWNGKPESPMFKNETQTDTLVAKLGWGLPLLGKEAVKLGYELPQPVGVDVFVYAHDQNMKFTGLQVGLDGNDLIDLENLFMLNKSSVKQSTFMPLFKADVWILPFLNLMAIVGGGNNELNGELVIDEELRDFINDLPGWIIDIPDIPRAIPIKTSITSEVYGGGLTLAGGVGSFNVSVNYQLMFTKVIEANTTNMVNVLTPMVGYMSPFGINFMIGGQGQFYNTKMHGFIEFEDNDGNTQKLNYVVNFEPIKWNAILGMYKVFDKHWEMSFQAGFGQRTSLTAIFGYRF